MTLNEMSRNSSANRNVSPFNWNGLECESWQVFMRVPSHRILNTFYFVVEQSKLHRLLQVICIELIWAELKSRRERKSSICPDQIGRNLLSEFGSFFFGSQPKHIATQPKVFVCRKDKRPSVHGYAKVQKAHRSHARAHIIYKYTAHKTENHLCASWLNGWLENRQNATHQPNRVLYRSLSRSLSACVCVFVCCRSDVCFLKISIIIA